MTEPSPNDQAAVAIELEHIRRTIEVGFTRTDGALALLVQRHDQSDETQKEHARRLDALERARWPLPSVAALVALCGLLLSLWQLTADDMATPPYGRSRPCGGAFVITGALLAL
ncbi:hypothetical protein [Streptomyces malaysiensis]|uniref:hypothetical protein n=1 Tax=Streptomyces malaysiensis TaxID=92644 RepID=UPI003F4CF46A